ncbi:MAG: hypothetical protein JWQ98_2847 [Chlorobi bacterium]|nr:hypothetical protein [Chlorobiota bacterium]
MNRNAPTRLPRFPLPPRLVLYCILFILSCGTIAAQTSSSPFGKHFFVVIPDTMRAYIGPFVNPAADSAQLVIFSNDTAHVTITAPGYNRSITVLPSASRTVSLLAPGGPRKPFIDTLGTATKNVLEIRSDSAITLLCYYVTHAGCEAFAPLPVESWGTEYRAMALRNQFMFDVGFTGALEEQIFRNDGPSQMIVIAAENGTQVTISAATTLTSARDTTFLLNAGEAFLVESDSTARYDVRYDLTPRDISGSVIRASKPIGVITGNTRTGGGAGAQAAPPPTGNSGRSSAVEWLFPTIAHGTTFVYRPIAPASLLDSTEEIIRIYATSPGITTITPSSGPADLVPEGGFVQYSYSLLADRVAQGSFTRATAFRTDQPAEAMVITGSFSRKVDPDASDYAMFETYAASMSLLQPRESWINSARFNAPSYPAYLLHYVVIVADSGVQMRLDASDITPTLTAVPGTPFVETRVPVAAGDHSIFATGGRFSAIAYGISRGSEGYQPPKARKDDDGLQGGRAVIGDALLPHPSKYNEVISIGYSYPILGVSDESLPPDSLSIDRIDECDSTIAVVQRYGLPWNLQPVTIRLDSDSVNIDARIVADTAAGIPVSYRIRFAPIDPRNDARGTLVITNASGRRWTIPFIYYADQFAITPRPLTFLDATINVERIINVSFTSRRLFPLTIRSIRLKNGGRGFSLRDTNDIGGTIAPGDSFRLTLAFTGTARNTVYDDTLIVETDCHTDTILVHARTGPSPVPAITGYDWKVRRVGSANDTLSFLSNSGSLGYTVRSVEIVGDAAGAFALTATPDWRGIAGVGPGEIHPAGIRFTPPAEGTFTARILLVTNDNDSAWGELRGIGALPHIEVATIDLGFLCRGDTLDTALTILSTGRLPLIVRSIRRAGIGDAEIAIDTASLPIAILPGDTARRKLGILPHALGRFADTLVVGSDAASGDSIVVITGTVRSCSRDSITVDDHDFDSVLITLTRQGFVTVRNLGDRDVTVTGMTLAGDTAAAFAILSPAAPFVVRGSDSTRVFCTFTPATIGPKGSRIEFTTEIGPLTSHLRGVGRKLTVPAFIRRDYHAPPGITTTIFVELEGRLDTLPVKRLGIAVGFAPELLDFLALSADTGGVLGWRYFGARDGDSIRCTIDVNVNPPGAGPFLAIRFLPRLSLLDSSELPFTIEAGLPYLEIIERPGLFRRDPICGLTQRLFVFDPNSFRLDESIPNPLRGEGHIDFEIPFDAPTTLIVYDALGQEILRLIDAELPAGTHTVVIPAGAIPPGLYYYRLVSSSYSAIRKLIVE